MEKKKKQYEAVKAFGEALHGLRVAGIKWVYAENGPGPEEYRKYYEAMDPATAEYLYQLVVKSSAASAQMQEYAAAYAAMKPEEAAAIFNTMGNSLELVGEILWSMTSAQRGAILAQMDPDIAAQVTRLMDPE